MSSSKNRRLLLSGIGVAMMMLSLLVAVPAFAQSGTSTPQATSSSGSSGSSGSTSASPSASASASTSQAVPSTGGAAAQCFTYQDLVNANLQPGALYYVANSGDTLQKIAQMFGVSTSQLISANPVLVSRASGVSGSSSQATSSSSGSSSATSQATSSSSGSTSATSSSSSSGSSSATPMATSSSGGATSATSSAGVPATGGFSMNSCVVSGVSSSSQALDQGQVNGQNFVLLPGEILRIPVSVSALIPATGGNAQATSSGTSAATSQATSSSGSSSSGSSSATPQATSSSGSSSGGSTSATPQATSSSGSSSGTSATPQANQGVPNTGLNFSVSPQEFQNRIFLFGASQGSVNSDGFYVAGNGDSLSRLASRWGVSVASILSVNPEIQNANMIYRGEGIRVPAGASLSGSENHSSVNNGNNNGSGDNDTNESPSVDNDTSR